MQMDIKSSVCISPDNINTMKHLSHIHLCRTLLPLLPLLLLVLSAGCGRSEYEQDVTGQLLYAERNLFYDFDHGHTLFASFDSIHSPHGIREEHLRTLLRYRLYDTWELDPDTLGLLTVYFSSRRDSLFAAIAYARRGDYYWTERADQSRSIYNLKQAKEWCPSGRDEVMGHILYSISQLYEVYYPERKMELLREATGLFERDSNLTYLGYCYRDMMLSHQDIDSARHYAALMVRPDFFMSLDTVQQMRLCAAFAEKFSDHMGGDLIIVLASPLYSYAPSPHLDYLLALGNIRNGDAFSASPYLDNLKADKTAAPLYHYLMSLIYRQSGDYRRALDEYMLYDDGDERLFRESSSRNIIALEKSVERQIEKKHEGQYKVKMLTWLVIATSTMLLSLIVAIAVYAFMKRRNRRFRHNAERAKAQLAEMQAKNMSILAEEFRSLKSRDLATVIKHIDIAANNLSQTLRVRHPLMKEKDIAILFLKHLGFSMNELAYYFGCTTSATIHSRLSRLKRELNLPPDTGIMQWFNEEIRDIAPALYKIAESNGQEDPGIQSPNIDNTDIQQS